MLHSFQLSNLPGLQALASILSGGQPVIPNADGHGWTAVNTAPQYGEQLIGGNGGEPANMQCEDFTQFGVNLKTCGQLQHQMSFLIDKR